MSMFVLTNVRLFAGAADLTSRSNKVELASDVEEKDATNYGSNGWKEVLGGLFSTTLMGDGQWEAGDLGKIDDDAWAALGTVHGYTVCPNTADVASVAWLSQALRTQYKLGGQVGDIAPWSWSASGSWPLARGRVLHPPGTARIASGSGTAVSHDAVPTGQYLYGSLHVLSVAGTATPTLTVSIESDVDGVFGTPTTQISFDAATTIGGQIKRTIGPITDTFYRAAWTITGTTPSFLFIAAVGVK